MSAAFQSSCADLVWSKAEGHFMGGGLLEGAPDTSCVLQVIKQLQAEGQHCKADALLAVACRGQHLRVSTATPAAVRSVLA